MRAGVQTADTTEFLTLQAPKAKICLKVNNEKMKKKIFNFQKFYSTSVKKGIFSINTTGVFFKIQLFKKKQLSFDHVLR